MLMFNEFLLVESIEMFREGLSHDWFNVGLTSLRASLKLEGLIDCLISCFKLELFRLVLRNSKVII